jgi:hypothetical protein
MMNTVVGSAIGGLVAGAVALGAAAAMRPSAAPVNGPDPNTNGYAMTVANTAPLNNGASLQCQPHEEAVLRRALVNGREVTDVTCITRSGSYLPPAAYAAPGYAQPYAQPYAAPAYQPVYRDEIVTRPVVRTRTVSQPARERVVTRRESNRSWGKTAMVIGGSTGAGAGIGGLIGGKKGALIGAAVGGGAATIYESRKR